jgi:hypothetical protein
LLRIAYPTELRTIVRTAPATSAVVSWNTTAPHGRIDLAIYRADGAVSDWLPYAAFDANGRRSLDGGDDVARIQTDIVRSSVPITAIEVRSDARFEMIAVSTPVYGPQPPAITHTQSLNVRPISQYLLTHPQQRGWCSPAAFAMLLDFWGVHVDVAEIAGAVYDDTYAGTGNWTFNTAFAAQCGLRGAVVHLSGVDHAAAFIAAGIPLALSIAWKEGDLPGAPLPASSGHLVVLRGFPSAQIAHVNDPAHTEIATMYLTQKLDTVWRAHGGVAYALVPPERVEQMLALANG